MAKKNLFYQDSWMQWLRTHYRVLLFSLFLVTASASAWVYVDWQQTLYQQKAITAYDAVLHKVANILQEYQEFRAIDSEEADADDGKTINTNFRNILIDINLFAEEYKDTVFAQYALLLKVRLLSMAVGYTNAIAEIDKILERDDLDENITSFAILSKARLMLYNKKGNEAIALLDASASNFASGAFVELRGDIYMALDRWQEAEQIYQEAKTLYGDIAPPISLLVKLQVAASESQARKP